MKIIYLDKLAFILIFAIIIAAASLTTAAQTGRGFGPELPVECAGINTTADQLVVFHAYAAGVQIYRWNGTSWDFVAPVANLYVDPYFQRQIGSHFAGPTWMTAGGTSSVSAARVSGCTPDINAIPWLLLKTTSSQGFGVFGGTTFIQRVNTTGGLAPVSPGADVGVEVRVPYAAEYFFYRAQQ